MGSTPVETTKNDWWPEWRKVRAVNPMCYIDTTVGSSPTQSANIPQKLSGEQRAVNT